MSSLVSINNNLEPSAPILDQIEGASSVVPLQQNQQAEQAVAQKIFQNLMFLPEDKAENKRYWTEFAENNLISSLWNSTLSKEEISELRRHNNSDRTIASVNRERRESAHFVAIILVLTVVIPLFSAMRYCIGKYKANQYGEAYDDLDTWQKKRQEAQNTGFKELIQTFGPERVRRYLPLGNTPEQNLAMYKKKFEEFLKSDEVVARQWAVQGRQTPWEDFISMEKLKAENLIEKKDTNYVFLRKIPKNKKRKEEVGAKIQNLNFEEFQQEFSQFQLIKEGVLTAGIWSQSAYTKLQNTLKPA